MKRRIDFEVKDGKVKVGIDWKTKTQLKREFMGELFVSGLFLLIAVLNFPFHKILASFALFVTLFFLIIAFGSFNALRAIEAKSENKKTSKN